MYNFGEFQQMQCPTSFQKALSSYKLNVISYWWMMIIIFYLQYNIHLFQPLCYNFLLDFNLSYGLHSSNDMSTLWSMVTIHNFTRLKILQFRWVIENLLLLLLLYFSSKKSYRDKKASCFWIWTNECLSALILVPFGDAYDQRLGLWFMNVLLL